MTAAVYVNTYEYLEVAELGTEFDGIPVEGYDKFTMQRVLAKTPGTVAVFVTEWADKQWHSSAAHVGHIADETSAIEGEEGWPAGNSAEAEDERNAWKLVAFLFNLQRSAGKVFHEATWIRSAAVPERLLATAQHMLSNKEDSEWECPIPALWIKVSEEIFSAK